MFYNKNSQEKLHSSASSNESTTTPTNEPSIVSKNSAPNNEASTISKYFTNKTENIYTNVLPNQGVITQNKEKRHKKLFLKQNHKVTGGITMNVAGLGNSWTIELTPFDTGVYQIGVNSLHFSKHPIMLYEFAALCVNFLQQMSAKYIYLRPAHIHLLCTYRALPP